MINIDIYIVFSQIWQINAFHCINNTFTYTYTVYQYQHNKQKGRWKGGGGCRWYNEYKRHTKALARVHTYYQLYQSKQKETIWEKCMYKWAVKRKSVQCMFFFYSHELNSSSLLCLAAPRVPVVSWVSVWWWSLQSTLTQQVPACLVWQGQA